MKIRYDPDVDAMYITMKKGFSSRTEEIDKNTLIDFNEKGELIGIELLFIKERNPAFVKEVLRSPNTTILS